MIISSLTLPSRVSLFLASSFRFSLKSLTVSYQPKPHKMKKSSTKITPKKTKKKKSMFGKMSSGLGSMASKGASLAKKGLDIGDKIAEHSINLTDKGTDSINNISFICASELIVSHNNLFFLFVHFLFVLSLLFRKSAILY